MNHKLAIILLLGVSATLADNTGGCIFNNGKGCQECYKRKSNYPSPTCGAPLTDGCLISAYNAVINGVICQQCEANRTLYLTQKNGKYEAECREGGVPDNCLSAVHQTGVPFNLCLGCKAGFYSVISTAPFQDKCIAAKDVKPKPIENCVEGGLVLRGQVKCFRCKDGFSRDEQGLECVKRTVTGCLINPFTDAYKCRGCDYFNGYFMNKDGVCVKTGQ